MMRHGFAYTCIALLVFVLLTLGAMVGGGALAASAIWPFVKTRSWTKTAAKIESASIERMQRQRNERRVCRVVYSYSVNGVEYHGTRASLYEGGAGSFDAALCRRVEKLQRAGKATCFYNPLHPSNSVLSRRMRHDVVCGALLILMVLGGAGMTAVAHGVDVLRRQSRADPRRIESEEKSWPLVPIGIFLYSTTLAVLSWAIGAVCIAEGDFDSIWTLTFGVVFLGVACYCGIWIYRCQEAGVLLLPEKANGGATFQIPWEAYGDATLTVQWVHRRSALETHNVGEIEDLRVVDIRDGMDGWAEVDVAELPRLPRGVLNCVLLQMKVSGYVGERKYNGRFDCGTIGEFRLLLDAKL